MQNLFCSRHSWNKRAYDSFTTISGGGGGQIRLSGLISDAAAERPLDPATTSAAADFKAQLCLCLTFTLVKVSGASGDLDTMVVEFEGNLFPSEVNYLFCNVSVID